jgi:hypothetical protein
MVLVDGVSLIQIHFEESVVGFALEVFVSVLTLAILNPLVRGAKGPVTSLASESSLGSSRSR